MLRQECCVSTSERCIYFSISYRHAIYFFYGLWGIICKDFSYCLSVILIYCRAISQVLMTYKLKWSTLLLNEFEAFKRLEGNMELTVYVGCTSTVFGTFTGLTLSIVHCEYCTLMGKKRSICQLAGWFTIEKYIFSPLPLFITVENSWLHYLVLCLWHYTSKKLNRPECHGCSCDQVYRNARYVKMTAKKLPVTSAQWNIFFGWVSPTLH